MQHKAYNNEYRTTLVCVDSYKNGVLAGRFYNPYLNDGTIFQSLTQFLIKMEHILDAMKLPQSFTAVRTFTSLPPADTSVSPALQSHEGILATFSLRIIFRQNSSWQGSVSWLETGRRQSFRSVLELIFLMDSALTGTRFA